MLMTATMMISSIRVKPPWPTGRRWLRFTSFIAKSPFWSTGIYTRSGGRLAGCGKTRDGMPGSGASWNKMRVTHLEEARMRGDDQQQPAMFSYISPEARVPQDHPLRAIRTLVDEVLAELSPRFETLYSRVGRPSI